MQKVLRVRESLSEQGVEARAREWSFIRITEGRFVTGGRDASHGGVSLGCYASGYWAARGRRAFHGGAVHSSPAKAVRIGRTRRP